MKIPAFHRLRRNTEYHIIKELSYPAVYHLAFINKDDMPVFKETLASHSLLFTDSMYAHMSWYDAMDFKIAAIDIPTLLRVRVINLEFMGNTFTLLLVIDAGTFSIAELEKVIGDCIQVQG